MSWQASQRFVVLVVMLLVGSCGRTPEDLRVTLHFDDVSTLVVGDDVRIGDLKVGEVERIEEPSPGRFEVAIVIQGKYRERATETSEFRLQRDGLTSPHRHIALHTKEGPPLDDGAIIAGKQSMLDGITDWARDLGEGIQNIDANKRLQEFAEAVREAAKRGKEEWEEAKPFLEEKAQELQDWAQEEAPALAETIRKGIEALFDQVEEDLEDAQA